MRCRWFASRITGIFSFGEVGVVYLLMENRGGQQEVRTDLLRRAREVDVVGAEQMDAMRREWKIDIGPSFLRGHCEDTRDSFTVSRESVQGNVSFFNGILASHAIAIKEPRLRFRFQPEAYRKIKNWAGPEALLRGVLTNRLDLAIPLGILAVLGALPVQADPNAGVGAMPFDYVRAILGTGLLLQAAAAQRWCHPGFLLLQSIWLVGLGLATGISIQRGASPWWALAIGAHLLVAYSGLRDWVRFRRGTY